MPVFDQDDLKDSMFEMLGCSDRAWSQRLGVALGRVIEVDTTDLQQVDLECIVTRIGEELHGA